MAKKFLLPGKVVLVLAGRFAGRKAVIIRNFDDGVAGRPYGHALVAGVDKYPKKITKAMNKRRINKRTKVRPFIQIVNYAHLMPTRYSLGESQKDTLIPDLQKLVTLDSLKKANRKTTKKEVRKVFQARHRSGQNLWFFTKLRF